MQTSFVQVAIAFRPFKDHLCTESVVHASAQPRPENQSDYLCQHKNTKQDNGSGASGSKEWAEQSLWAVVCH